MLYLHTLGDALIKVDEKEIRPTSPLMFAALLYLGMERGRRVPRTALQEMLFPNADERSGAHSMRQLLYKLRQLGAPLSTNGDVVITDSTLVCDETSDLAALASSDPNRLARGFVPEYAPIISERLTEWVEMQRASVAAGGRRILIESLAKSRNAARWQDVEKLARLVLSMDAFNEEATLALAEANASAGGKLEALGILRRYERETGMTAPSLPPAVLRRRISERLPDSANNRTPFVGRNKDIEGLRREIANTETRGPIALVGEAGIGKTRLLHEVLTLAALDGAGIYTVRCKPHHVTRPLGVVTELVPLLLRARGAIGISPASLRHLTLLTRSSDDLHERPADARDDTTRSRIVTTAFRDLVDAVANEGMLVVAIEDIQWSDRDSLHELTSLTSRLASGLTLLLTARSLEPACRDVLLQYRASIRRIKPLDDQAMTELARRLVPQTSDLATDRERISWCVRRAAGNPLFLQMLCADAAESKRPFDVPRDLMAATSDRIDQLPPQCRRLLEFSALLGRRATVDALRKVSQYSDLDLLDAIQRLEEEGFLALTAANVYAAHDLVGECAVNRLNPGTRTFLHDCVARYLESEYQQANEASLLWDCADQWAWSGDARKAVEFLTRCARHAMDIGQARHALDILRRAEGFATEDRLAATVLAEMVIAARTADQWGLVFSAADALARLPSEAFESAHGAHELITIEASWERGLAALTSLPVLMACASTVDAPIKHRLEAAVLALRISHEYGDPESAERLYRTVEPLLANKETLTAWMVPLIYHTSFGDRGEALATARALAKRLPEWPSVAERLTAAVNVGTALCFLGQPQESLALFSTYYDQAQAIGLPEWQLDLAAPAMMVGIDREDRETAELWYARCEPLINAVEGGERRRLTRDIGVQGEIALLRNDVAKAMTLISEMRVCAPDNSTRTRAYLATFEVRLRQKRAGYQSDDTEIEILRNAYSLARDLSGMDYVVVCFAEALRRRNMSSEAYRALTEYLFDYRREQSPPPPSMEALIRQCKISELPSYCAGLSRPALTR